MNDAQKIRQEGIRLTLEKTQEAISKLQKFGYVLFTTCAEEDLTDESEVGWYFENEKESHKGSFKEFKTELVRRYNLDRSSLKYANCIY